MGECSRDNWYELLAEAMKYLVYINSKYLLLLSIFFFTTKGEGGVQETNLPWKTVFHQCEIQIFLCGD